LSNAWSARRDDHQIALTAQDQVAVDCRRKSSDLKLSRCRYRCRCSGIHGGVFGLGAVKFIESNFPKQ
jgi:hypothetical protein